MLPVRPLLMSEYACFPTATTPVTHAPATIAPAMPAVPIVNASAAVTIATAASPARTFPAIASKKFPSGGASL